MEQHQHYQSLQDQAYNALRSKIIYAELRPGTRLSAIGLEKETGIGRTPIRESFVRLREQELVETRPKSGTYVSKISMERAENACFLREKLERSVLIKCCSAASPEQKQRIEQILAESESLDHSETRRFFDLDNLRWNKVVICTDADVDGFQIRTLILTMLYRLTPTLIQQGYVYIAESPLYEITCKEKTWFAYSDKEKNDIVASLEGKKCDVQRSKGLGENEPDMMWLTTMNPETRRLIKVMPEDVERTAQVFDLLLGDDLQGRKSHIADNGYKYLELADIS